MGRSCCRDRSIQVERYIQEGWLEWRLGQTAERESGNNIICMNHARMTDQPKCFSYHEHSHKPILSCPLGSPPLWWLTGLDRG